MDGSSMFRGGVPPGTNAGGGKQWGFWLPLVGLPVEPGCVTLIAGLDGQLV